MKGLFSGLIVCLLLLIDNSNGFEIRSVLSSDDPRHLQQAWMDNQFGLILVRDPEVYPKLNQEVLLSLLSTQSKSVVLFGLDASEPRFDVEDGSLYFEMTTDNGHVVLSRHLWVLPYLSDSPKEVKALPVVQPTFNGDKLNSSFSSGAPIRICIDPGHGGSDPGAVGQGYEEADITLDVALRLRNLLNADSGRWTVLMTRTTDVDVSLSGRCTMCNNWPGDRFISIHCNSFSSSSAQGTETFSYQEGTTAAKMRDSIQSEMIKAWGLTNRGSKTADFYVLRNTNMPAALSEMGFISSPVDIVKLRDPNARQQIAAAHMYALRRHYGFASSNDD